MALIPVVNDSVNHSAVRPVVDSDRVQKSGGSQDLQHAFLKLLVAQMRNQDPTNPLQNNELTSQLAQISTLQGIEKLNTSLGSIAGQIDNSQSLHASTLIGHGVMIPGNAILTASAENKTTSTPFGVELERTASSVTATIADREGNVIRELNLGSLRAGVHSFTWDGQLQNGAAAPDGAFYVTLNARNGDEQVLATALTFARVNGIIRTGQGSQLDLGLAGVTTLDNVRQIL